jgi:glycerophosphoryl diester phosphodiesterase
MSGRLLWAGLAVMSGGVLWADPLPKTPAGRLVGEDRVLVIAHRGDSKAAPENTLPAFESAVKVGSDMVELDYVHTADGVPIVIHDDTLDRTTDAEEKWSAKKVKVESKKLAELAGLDAGMWFDPKFKGTKLPTLEESLDLIQKGSVTLIERKEGDAKTCVDLLERKEMVQDVVVQAFDWKFLGECRKLRKDLVLGALGSGKLTPEKIEELKETGAQAVGWQFLALREKEIQMLHDAGFKVWAWTVDDEKAAERLMGWGIDGIISNYPGRIKGLVERSSTAKK